MLGEEESTEVEVNLEASLNLIVYFMYCAPEIISTF